jgi:hydroxylamine reductase (hybrid-cluster protein)
MSRKPIRAELIQIIQNDCLKTQRVEKGLKTRKLKELFDTITRLNIDLSQRLKDIRERSIVLYPDDETEDEDEEDETTEYFKDKEKRNIFISMYKKDYTENKEKNRKELQEARGERINKNTFNHNGILIMYGLLPESAEEEDFSIIVKHFNIKVNNGEVTFKI